VREEQKDSIEQRIANMTRQQRLAHMASLLAPMRQYLSELDDEEQVGAEAEAEPTPIARGALEPA